MRKGTKLALILGCIPFIALVFALPLVNRIEPVMGGEDFAYFLRKVPGAFLFFGMGDGMEFQHHHPAFDLDEKSLHQGALLMASLALEYLATVE